MKFERFIYKRLYIFGFMKVLLVYSNIFKNRYCFKGKIFIAFFLELSFIFLRIYRWTFLVISGFMRFEVFRFWVLVEAGRYLCGFSVIFLENIFSF